MSVPVNERPVALAAGGSLEGAAPGSNGRQAVTASVAAALEAALKARSPELHASTPMVCQLALRVCRTLGLSEQEQALAFTSARVRDVGMIALPDAVALATGALSHQDWELVNRHPGLGAELLQGLEGMEAAAVIVRSHHERWDGEGYPDGRRGEAIPLLARVIAGCDAFVALASDRPHRRGAGTEVALEHVSTQRGAQLDPRVVDALVQVLSGGGDSGEDIPAPSRADLPARDRQASAAAPAEPSALRSAIAQFDTMPAFGPAVDRLVAAMAAEHNQAWGDMISAIESDTGLTIAIMRAAAAARGRRPITNLADAVALLGQRGIEEALAGLERAAFPWRTQLEAFMHHLRVHAQAVARAAERIATVVDLEDRDELLVAALLHDVGRLVLVQARAGLAEATDARSTTPERRIQAERRAVGLDHASIGGLLLSRWGLPPRLGAAVAGHHSAEGAGELATLVRLADMIAHHAHGDSVDRRLMLRLAGTCGVPVAALRDALFDLPHAGGSRRRRAEASPLSDRETDVLRGLAEGKVYKQIGRDLSLSTSTVRTHLHNAYSKLNVADRAQAVLRATEMAWI